MKDGIPHRNHSPHGWWIASYMQRAAWDDERTLSDNTRCLAWENTIIIQAPDREAAYAKAIAFASLGTTEFEDTSRRNRKGHWVLEGLTSLLPIYDELKDGAEVLWVEHENRTIKTIRSRVRPKAQLEVFDDTPSVGDVIGGGDR